MALPKSRKKTVDDLILRIRYDNQLTTELEVAYIHGTIGTINGKHLMYEPSKGVGKYRGVKIFSWADKERLANPEISSPMRCLPLEWEANHHTLEECKVAVSTLTMLEKKMEGFAEDFGGPATTFGHWVERVCRAIGLDKVQIARHEGLMSPGKASGIIDAKIEAWQKWARSLPVTDSANQPE